MKKHYILLSTLLVAVTTATAQVKLVEYDWQTTGGKSQLDPGTLAAGVSATTIAEIGDVDGMPGISNFSGSVLNIKRSALDDDLTNSNNSLSFSVSATNPGEILDIDTLDMFFNVIQGTDLFSFRIFGNTGSGEQTLFTSPANLESFASTSQSFDISNIGSAANIDFRIEYASASQGPSDFSLQTGTIGLTGVTAIPEPSTYALLGGLGVLAVAMVRRRRICS